MFVHPCKLEIQLPPLTAPFPSKEKVTGKLRRYKVCTEKQASTQLLWMPSRFKLKVQQRRPGIRGVNLGSARQGTCGGVGSASRVCNLALSAPELQARTLGYTFLHPALRPARAGTSRGALPARRSGLPSGGSGEGLLRTEDPGIPLSLSQAHTGPGPPRTLVQTPAPNGRLACAFELGSTKLLHPTSTRGRRPHGPSTCTHPRSRLLRSAKIPLKRAWRVRGRRGVLTPPSCPLPPRPAARPGRPSLPACPAGPTAPGSGPWRSAPPLPGPGRAESRGEQARGRAQPSGGGAGSGARGHRTPGTVSAKAGGPRPHTPSLGRAAGAAGMSPD